MTTVLSEIVAKASENLQKEVAEELLNSNEEKDLEDLLDEDENSKRDDRGRSDGVDSKDCEVTR